MLTIIPGKLSSRKKLDAAAIMFKKTLAEYYRRLPIVRQLHEILQNILYLQERVSAVQALRLLDFDLPKHPRYGDEKRLLRYHGQVSSQNGEDGIIHEIFRRIGTTNRVFAEVGVGNGSENNTAFLLSQGWTGFWIDGSDSLVETLRGRTDLSSSCLKWLVSFVTRENIAGLFDQLAVPEQFDLLSLDIDQNTYYAWEGLSRFKPRVVVVEYNGAVPADVEWKVNYVPDRAWDRTQNFGASLKAFEKLGAKLGYSLVGCEFIGSNAFFVRNDLTAKKFAEPFTAENHYEPPRYPLTFRRCHPPGILDRDGQC
jgi:hypothetical protein